LGGEGLGILEGGFFVFLGVVFCGFLDEWALPVAWLLIPDFRHAHTLQQPKSISWTLTPGRVFKEILNNMKINRTTKLTDLFGIDLIIYDEYTSYIITFRLL